MRWSQSLLQAVKAATRPAARNFGRMCALSYFSNKAHYPRKYAQSGSGRGSLKTFSDNLPKTTRIENLVLK
jgi:hypothetical protein